MTFPYLRLRRLRDSKAVRSLIQDTVINVSDLIYPIIVHDISGVTAIAGFPDIYRHDIPSMLKQVEQAASLGIKAVAIFPSISAKYKTLYAEESYNANGLVQQEFDLF